MGKKQKVDQLKDVHAVDLETLLKFTGSVVFALRNRFKKRVQVYGSSTGLAHLGRLLEEIKISGEYTELRQDLEELEVVILETNVEDVKLKIVHYTKQYEDLGYALYRDIAPVKYVLETTIEYKASKMYYCLYAVNRKRKRCLLGTFTKKKQLTSFMKEHYPSGRVSALVYDSSVVGTSNIR